MRLPHTLLVSDFCTIDAGDDEGEGAARNLNRWTYNFFSGFSDYEYDRIVERVRTTAADYIQSKGETIHEDEDDLLSLSERLTPREQHEVWCCALEIEVSSRQPHAHAPRIRR